MTAKELRELLRDLPDDAVLMAFDHDFGGMRPADAAYNGETNGLLVRSLYDAHDAGADQ